MTKATFIENKVPSSNSVQLYNYIFLSQNLTLIHNNKFAPETAAQINNNKTLIQDVRLYGQRDTLVTYTARSTIEPLTHLFHTSRFSTGRQFSTLTGQSSEA
jgi:hypothetical protein